MKTAFLYPGQGAQTLGMGADLYMSDSAYRRTFDACEQGAELDLKAACFEGIGMEEGQIVQPAIFAHSMGLFMAIREAGFEAQAHAGLSLGEYSALAAAGVFGMAQAAALLRERGRLMDQAYPKGSAGMLSVVGLSYDDVQRILRDVPDAYLANHLSDSQFVVAGYLCQLNALKNEFDSRGAKLATLLNVRGPSHAPLLNAAADAFSEVLQAVPLGSCQDKVVYSGALGAPYPHDADVAMLLSMQMRSRLCWHDCVEHMIDAGYRRFVEIGPSNVLSKILKRRVGQQAQVISVRDYQTLNAFIGGKEA